MRAPKRFHSQSFADGTELKFRLTVGSIRKLEESTGKTWQEVMNTMDEDPIQSFVDIVWAASLPFDKAFKKENSEEVYDMLIDEGEDQVGINKFIMKVLQVSGLFPKDKDVDEYMDDLLDEAEEEASEEDPK